MNELEKEQRVFQSNVTQILDEVKQLLFEKNKKYGNSALEPRRVFSKSSSTEQICVRIDDKLSRIATLGYDPQKDEDTIQDLIGYLVILKMAQSNN